MSALKTKEVSWVNQPWDYINNGPQNKTNTEDEIQTFISGRQTNFRKRTTPNQAFSLAGLLAGGVLLFFGKK